MPAQRIRWSCAWLTGKYRIERYEPTGRRQGVEGGERDRLIAGR